MTMSERKHGVSCPDCGSESLATKDTRPVDFHGLTALRRRHPCDNCNKSFVTLEIPEQNINRIDCIASLVIAAAKAYAE